MRARCEDWTLDSDTREVRRDGRLTHISPKAFELLVLLVEERPRAIKKEELFDRIWPHTHVAESNLAGLINEIRIAIGDDARRPFQIRTVFGHGYAFIGNVAVEEAAERPIASIVVLPFKCNDPEWEYVADGIAEDLINSLTRL